jgi:hypothetical protein
MYPEINHMTYGEALGKIKELEKENEELREKIETEYEDYITTDDPQYHLL